MEMKQRGFLQLTPLLYGAIAAGAIILALSGAVWVQTARLSSANSTIAATKVIGKAAEAAAKKKEKDDKRSKEKADEQNRFDTASLRVDLERVQRSAGRSIVPLGPPGARRPDLVTFDRAELDTALRRFTAGAGDLVGEGAKATVDLNTARKWAQP
jgi:hypothetical protein